MKATTASALSKTADNRCRTRHAVHDAVEIALVRLRRQWTSGFSSFDGRKIAPWLASPILTGLCLRAISRNRRCFLDGALVVDAPCWNGKNDEVVVEAVAGAVSMQGVRHAYAPRPKPKIRFTANEREAFFDKDRIERAVPILARTASKRRRPQPYPASSKLLRLR